MSNIPNVRFGYYNVKLVQDFNFGISLSKLNYIKYKDKILIEVNEKIMQILKEVIQTTDIFDNLYDYVYENKFTKRAVVCLDSKFNIKLINSEKYKKIVSIESLINSMSKKNLRKFIKLV